MLIAIGNGAADVGAWLPPECDAALHSFVVFMQDDQNLLDPRLTVNGEIRDVDNAVVRLVEAGIIPPAIVLGVFNTAVMGSSTGGLPCYYLATHHPYQFGPRGCSLLFD